MYYHHILNMTIAQVYQQKSTSDTIQPVIGREDGWHLTRWLEYSLGLLTPSPTPQHISLPHTCPTPPFCPLHTHPYPIRLLPSAFYTHPYPTLPFASPKHTFTWVVSLDLVSSSWLITANSVGPEGDTVVDSLLGPSSVFTIPSPQYPTSSTPL